jgi:protease I
LKPIAFLCHGGWVAASAGIVAGRHVTGNPAIEDDMRNAGAEWEDAEVVVDGHLVSSRKPDDLPAFLPAMIEVVVRAPAPA